MLIDTLVFSEDASKIGGARRFQVPAHNVLRGDQRPYLVGLVTYHPFKKDKVSPPWATVAFGMYTTNKSWLIGLKQEAYWDRDNNRASLAVGLGKFNSQFYGTGSSNDIGMSLPLTSKALMINPRDVRRIWDRPYLGGQYRLLWNEATFGVPEMLEGVPPPDYLPLTSSLLHSGFGVVGEYDSRDNRFSATKGFYVPANTIFYAKAFGGEANFADVDLAVNYTKEASIGAWSSIAHGVGNSVETAGLRGCGRRDGASASGSGPAPRGARARQRDLSDDQRTPSLGSIARAGGRG
jgi:hypothetical protein